MKIKKDKVVTANPTMMETETTKLDKRDLDANCDYCLKKIPISLGRIEKIKDQLRAWYDENPEAKAISEFYHTLGISHNTYYRLLHKDPELKELHESTLRRLGNRLWGKSVDNKANWNAVRFMLHQYAPEFKEAKEFDANLAKKEDNAAASAPQFIVIKDFEDSKIVPKKKDDKA